jgi:hypothetical protein
MTHTQAESFYNFAYVRRFLVLVRFKNRPHVLNLTDVTPRAPSLWFLYLGKHHQKWIASTFWCALESKFSAMPTNDIERTQIEMPLNSEIVYNYLDNCTKIEIFGTKTSFLFVPRSL